jgi:IPT/TIG domain-containing protein/YXWGXW repeat-containing protein
MRHVAHWLIGIGAVTTLGVGATTSFAQPNDRDHRPPPAERDHRRLPPPADGPTEAPPAPRAETPATRAGFVWVSGRWDWRGNKWEWLAGHAEREHAGKRWREGHWDHRGDRWAYSDGTWIDAAADVPPAPSAQDDYPREAPPPPREENMAPRAGFEWAPGRWDWRRGKWEWVAGHWEREHPGKHWNTGRWDRQGDRWAYVEGNWGDRGGPPPGPTPAPSDDRPDQPPPPPDESHRGDRGDHHREWKLDRPMVSSYWPTKGKVGSRIVIHGRNFPADTVVSWGGTQVNGAKVSPEEIVVAVPPGATSGMIALRAGHGRELTVGTYQVADFDADADARRRDDDARRRAEQDWANRQSALAKDMAARRTAMDRHYRELTDTREQRREQRQRELREKWEAAFLADPDTQSELMLHAQRAAELARMHEVAELSENGKLVIRIGVAQSREDERHQDRMSALHDAFGGRKP